MVKILIVDPLRSIRNTLRERLEFEGYTAETAEGLTDAATAFGKVPFDIVILDGALFEQYTATSEGFRFPDTTFVLVLSAHPSIDAAVHAVRNGAFDFAAKPVDMNHLLGIIREACRQREEGNTPVSVVPTRRAHAHRTPHVEEIIGNSRQILHVKRLIDKVAPSEARVLIMGANGTGKELVARWLHEKSSRCDHPFVEVNCAAIPSELIESELFGHEKGAFTSAIRQRKGKFEQADGGTLFMDEIGDMSLSAQAKVLRALQENRISRVGSDKDLEIDVRVIAATNKNLQEEIRKGNFRENLYHRLSVIVISVPPLSERLDDIPLLVDYFVEKISAEYNMAPKAVDRDALDELKAMGWSGNIRELRNVIERLLILSGDRITSEDVRTYALGVA